MVEASSLSFLAVAFLVCSGQWPMILPRNLAGLQVTLVVNLSPILKHWSGMLASLREADWIGTWQASIQGQVLCIIVGCSCGWINDLICWMIRLVYHQWKILHNWAWQIVLWVSSLFPGFVEVQHLVGASLEGDSVVHWLLPVHISAGRGQWSLCNGWGRWHWRDQLQSGWIFSICTVLQVLVKVSCPIADR